MARRAVEVDLADDERALLLEGLRQWGGSASPTHELAKAMGFESVRDLDVERRRIADDLEERHQLSARDWTRALVCTEVIIASDVFGAGVEWAIVTPFDDETAVRVLRAIQRKLVTHRISLTGR